MHIQNRDKDHVVTPIYSFSTSRRDMAYSSTNTPKNVRLVQIRDTVVTESDNGHRISRK